MERLLDACGGWDLEVTGVMAAGRWVPRQAPPARVGPVRNTTSPGGR